MILYGASGHAKVIIEAYLKSGEIIEFLFDDNTEIKTLSLVDVQTGYNSSINSDSKLIVSIGDNKTRKKISEKIKHSFGKVIHPKAVIADGIIIKEGSVVFANVVIQPSTIIGKHVIVNTRASIDHDCKVDDFVHIAPGVTICGGVKVGEGSFIGAAAVILPNITIGKWTTVGAGAVVTKNIGNNETWVGNPARRIK